MSDAQRWSHDEAARLAALRATAQDAWSRDDAAEEVPSVCASCGGSGIVGYRYTRPGSYSDVEYIRCHCYTPTPAAARAGGMDGYRDKTFTTFVALPSVAGHAARCAAFAEKPEGWLLMVGPYGTGKSHLAMAIGNRQLDLGSSVYFATVPDLLSDLKATFDGGGETYTKRFERIRNVGLLILDDFGTEKPSDWNQEKMFQIVNHRYQRRMPTVITTNVDLRRIDGRLDSRLSDLDLVERLDFAAAADYRKLDFERRRGGAR